MRHLMLVAILVLAGCAQPVTAPPKVDAAALDQETERQQEMVHRVAKENWERRGRIELRMGMDNLDICGDAVGFSHSFYLALPSQPANAPTERAWRKVWAIKDHAAVYVIPGGAAHAAGLRDGDQVHAVDGESPARTAKEMNVILDQMSRNGSPITLTISRDGKLVPIEIHPAKKCLVPTQTITDDRLNAHADGESIFITTGMMAFLKDDDELAIVIGHEMAHNLMGHIKKKKGNAAIGAFLGAIFGGLTGRPDAVGVFADAGANAYSQDFEAEADVVGAYLAARAGYSVKDAAGLWRRMAVRNPSAIHANDSASHPSTVHRLLVLEKVAAEIEAKRAAGLPLVPEMKK